MNANELLVTFCCITYYHRSLIFCALRKQILQDEVMKHEEILKNMKDYDENLAKEKIARAFQEKEMRRMEVSTFLHCKRQVGIYSSGLHYLMTRRKQSI